MPPNEEDRDKQIHDVTIGAAAFIDRLDDEVMGYMEDMAVEVRNVLQALMDRGSPLDEAMTSCINIVVSIVVNERSGGLVWNLDPDNEEGIERGSEDEE